MCFLWHFQCCCDDYVVCCRFEGEPERELESETTGTIRNGTTGDPGGGFGSEKWGYDSAHAGRSLELCRRAGYLPSQDVAGVTLYCTRLVVELSVAHRQGQLGRATGSELVLAARW